MPNKPKLGQNFLNDSQAVERIAASLGDLSGRTVLEIGPGDGVITSLLAAKARHVVAAVLDRAVLMVQREVADRVTAQPGSRDYGLLSVTVQMYGPAQSLFTLPPSAFSPPPDVHSTVFRWRFEPRFAELGVDEAGFQRFVRTAFAQKRKTLANNLRAAGIAPAAVESALSSAGLDQKTRAETLPAETFAVLFKALANVLSPKFIT